MRVPLATDDGNLQYLDSVVTLVLYLPTLTYVPRCVHCYPKTIGSQDLNKTLFTLTLSGIQSGSRGKIRGYGILRVAP